jgi:glycosyltransferase involved in cell wall biosynthesis
MFVSVVLPTFNRADTILRAIDSVLVQTHGCLELVVINDGSSDGTDEVLRGLSDERVRTISLDRNRGQSAARNVGIRACRGDLVAFQDSDDEWLPNKLALQLDVLARQPDLAGVYCDMMRIDANGEHYMKAPDLVVGAVAVFVEEGLFYQSFGIGTQSCVLRKDVLSKARGFREDMRCFEDLELLLYLAQRHRFHRVPQPLVRYYDSDGVSKNSEAERDARGVLLRRYGARALKANPAAVLREVRSLRAMGVEIPSSLLARADEMVQ